MWLPVHRSLQTECFGDRLLRLESRCLLLSLERLLWCRRCSSPRERSLRLSRCPVLSSLPCLSCSCDFVRSLDGLAGRVSSVRSLSPRPSLGPRESLSLDRSRLRLLLLRLSFLFPSFSGFLTLCNFFAHPWQTHTFTKAFFLTSFSIYPKFISKVSNSNSCGSSASKLNPSASSDRTCLGQVNEAQVNCPVPCRTSCLVRHRSAT